MKAYLEKITVEGNEVEVAFEFLHVSEPVQVDLVNGISSLNLVPEYRQACEVACGEFLKEQALAKKEELAQAKGDQERDAA